jgi:hypothetical protein
MDLLYRHGEQPYHALVGGGDQLYCDASVLSPIIQSLYYFRLTLTEQYYSGARTPSVGHVSRLRGEGEDARDPCHCISY